MPNNKIDVKPELLESIKELCDNNKEMLVVSLCTTDGFSIKSFASKGLNTEADKLAAMSSTISALSNSIATQLLKEEFDITIVEATHGNALFVKTNYLKLPCVLAVAARADMALATVRYKTKKLAQEISSITE